MASKQPEQSWKRRDDENDAQYRLFQLFLEHRNLDTVALLYNDNKTDSIAVEYVKSLRTSKRWERRVRDYDNWIASNRADAHVKLVENEVKLIASRRKRILDGLYKRIIQAEEQLGDNPDVYALRTYANIVTAIDDIWQKMEKNYAAYSAQGIEDMERQLASAKDRIKKQAAEIVRKRNDKPTNPTPTEFIQ